MSKKPAESNDPRDKTLSGFFNAVDPQKGSGSRYSPNASASNSPKWQFAKNTNQNTPPNPNLVTDRRTERSGTVITVEYFQDKDKEKEVEAPKRDDTFDDLQRMSLTRTNSDSDLSRKSSSANLIVRSSSFSDLSDVM